MTDSTVARGDRKAAKPAKPRPDFPLYPHAVGKWAKTVNGKTYYFGRWDDPQGALNEYLDQKDDLYAGRTPGERKGDLTIGELCNEFLRHCKSKVQSGEMVPRTLLDYTSTTDRIVRVLGKGKIVERLQPADFAKLRADIANGRSPVSVAGEITRARVAFNYGRKNLLIEHEVRYGMAFQRPSKKTIRQAKAKNGKRMFEAEECRSLLDNAQTPELRAMILLALNCGFGNADCAKLPLDAMDLKRGWVDYPRPKTGVDRRCPLWPETIKALQAVFERRPKREQLAIDKRGGETNLVFLTKYGRPYTNDQTTVTNEFAKLLDELNLRRHRRGFYSLRHVFRTVADNTRDFPAIRLIMGHVDDSMDAVYTDHIEDSRLQAIVDHVHSWLYGKG